MSRIVLLLAAGGLAGAAGAVEVRVDYDPTVDLSAYVSYGWLEGTPAQDPVLERTVRARIERELVPNGFKEVRENPDLLLLTHTSLDAGRSIDIEAFEYWTDYRGWKRPLAVSEESYETLMGMLIVDMLDGQTGELVWRGVATGAVAKKIEKRGEKLDQVMAKMFRGFPPKYRPPK